jgi:hypothetical protein
MESHTGVNRQEDILPTKKKFTVKDSGARQSFDTGAVRDIQAGKGRFDLITPFMLQAVDSWMQQCPHLFHNDYQGMPR